MASWCTSCAAARSTAPPAIKARPIRRTASRRVMSDIALPHFFREILGGAPRQRHDGMRRVLVGIADEHGAVGHEQVLHLVRLTEAVQRAALRVVADADGPHLVADR